MVDFIIYSLKSDFLISLVTLIVGSIAFYLYGKQRKDRKRDAARLILQEIRYAEQKIRKYREVQSYKLYDKLLPTNSWNDNIHLFIKELKEVQIDLISDFYAKTSYIDTLIATISRQKNNPIIITSTPPIPLQQSIIPIIPESQPIEDYQGPTPLLPPTPIQPPRQSRPPHPIEILPVSQDILKDVSMNVEFVYNTPVVEKLREISEKKWYQLF